MTPEEIEEMKSWVALPALMPYEQCNAGRHTRLHYLAEKATGKMEEDRAEIESLRHERDTLLEANNGFKVGLMRILGTEHETYSEYLNEIADLKSGRDAMKRVVLDQNREEI